MLMRLMKMKKKIINCVTAEAAATITDFEIKGLKNEERTRYRFDYVFKKPSSSICQEVLQLNHIQLIHFFIQFCISSSLYFCY